jgi:hypothetical protein
MGSDSPVSVDPGPKSFFSLPIEIRNLIYENLLISPLPLPPTPPQSEQNVYTAILRTNRCVYLEAIDILYEHNLFAIHLRSSLHKVAYEPFLSNLTADNAAKIKELEIVLWGNHTEDDGDTVQFGTENFGIALQNLIYAPKLVVCIDIVIMKREELEEDSVHATTEFCAFDWLMATFADEWFFSKTYFDLFRAVARFHMSRMFPVRRFPTCESRWFSDARATPGSREHEQRRLWELEDRYGLPHEEDEERPEGSEDEDRGSEAYEEDMGDAEDDEDDKDMENSGDDEGDDEEDEEDKRSTGHVTNVRNDENDNRYASSSS